MDQEMAAAAV